MQQSHIAFEGKLRRICYGCNNSYPLTEKYFECVRITRVKKLFRNYCWSCWRKEYKRDKTKISAYNAAYYQRNRDRLLAKAKMRKKNRGSGDPQLTNSTVFAAPRNPPAPRE